MVDRRIELTAAVDRLDVEQRSSTVAAQAAANALADLERRALGGEDVSATKRRTSEQELSRARARAAEPWAERAAGANAAVADVDQAIARLVTQRFDDLADGLRAQGDEAAQAVDDAAGALIAAYERREAIASRMNALSSMIRPTRPGDVSASRADALAREAGRLLDGGGERPPDMRDPRQPRHSAAAEGDDADAVAVIA